MKFTLLTGTKDRVGELERMFRSLVAQEHQDFEAIIVDQNPDDRLADIVSRYKEHFPILHIKHKTPGLALARNVGRPHITGDVVCFPDDDSVYPPGVLSKVNQLLNDNPKWDGIAGRVLELDGNENAFETCGGDDRSGFVDRPRAYFVGVSSSMFFRAPIVKKMAFDETMGPGAPPPRCMGEDTDYMIRCVDAGHAIYYDATLHVRHPNVLRSQPFRKKIARAYQYGEGQGAFHARHDLPFSLIGEATYGSPLYRLALSALIKGRAQYCAYYFVKGTSKWIGYHKARLRQIKQHKRT